MDNIRPMLRRDHPKVMVLLLEIEGSLMVGSLIKVLLFHLIQCLVIRDLPYTKSKKKN